MKCSFSRQQNYNERGGFWSKLSIKSCSILLMHPGFIGVREKDKIKDLKAQDCPIRKIGQVGRGEG